MFKAFTRYFFLYVFRAKTRQRLLVLALSGLFISSMSLIILQSTMGGLQSKLMTRSKIATGYGQVILPSWSQKKAIELQNKIPYQSFLEYEIELLMRHKGYLSPVIVHGVGAGHRADFLPDGQLQDIIMPEDLALKMNIDEGDQVELISPAHVNSLMGDIPRIVVGEVQEYVTTDVPEVDLYHLWIRIGMAQTLVRKRVVNRITLTEDFDSSLVVELLNDYEGAYLKTWEEQNENLVFALRLETTVMVFLFVAMTMLVSLCITSGLMIFFGKIKGDLASFWILGAARKHLQKLSALFFALLSGGAVILGLMAGLLLLWVLDQYAPQVMPAVFVDRRIPVHITITGVLISSLVPFVIALIFSFLSYGQLKKETKYLSYVRSIG